MRIEEGYTALDGYTQYALYSDENIYEIAEDRSIPDITQITMKGDTNSQYITFQMPRYFDGVDLTTKQIIVRWYNDKNVEVGGSYSDICDVRYNEEFIRFAWLLDFGVTEVPGGVGFSFESIGTNEVENSYVWKTGIGKLPITDNMDNGAGGDEPSEDWFTKLINHICSASAATLAEETKAGNYGNGTIRKTVLGDRYDEVQKIINGGSATKKQSRSYTVKKNDNLTKIAKTYGTTVNAIVQKNKKKYPKITANFICVGWVLEV